MDTATLTMIESMVRGELAMWFVLMLIPGFIFLASILVRISQEKVFDLWNADEKSEQMMSIYIYRFTNSFVVYIMLTACVIAAIKYFTLLQTFDLAVVERVIEIGGGL